MTGGYRQNLKSQPGHEAISTIETAKEELVAAMGVSAV
jgi:hypothetical protein